MKYLIKTALSFLLSGLTFIQALDTGAKICSVLVALFVAWLQWKSYHSRKRIEDEQFKQLQEKKNEK